MPTPDNLHSLNYYNRSLGYLYLNDWRIKILESGSDSESGGRLNLYIEVKKTPSTERYAANFRTVGRVEGDGWPAMGCLLLVMETSRYTRVLYRLRVCQLCDRGEVEDQCHVLAIFPTL